MARTSTPSTPTSTPAAASKRRRHDGAHEQDDVQAFLDRFGQALTHGDGHAIAALWETPAYVLADDDMHDVRAVDEVEAFFNGARRLYGEQGIAQARPGILDLEWLTARIVLVHVRWAYLDAAGREVGIETSTYTLRRDREDRLRLKVAVMQGIDERPAH